MATGGQALAGLVRGGQQPVSGASIALYAAGSTGSGSGALSLLRNAVSTDANGGFSITGDYVCPTASTQVYLVARGGNPGLAANTSNPALVLMTVLGDCGSLNAATFVTVNEATTVATAWALDRFLAAGAVIGASATNTVGLGNAFRNASDLVSTSTGFAPGSLPTGATLEVAKLNSLADSLAPCVNSDGGPACAPLFAAALGATNTLDAALQIVRNPGANVAAVFALAAPQPPFQPVLSSAPHDWTLSLTLGNCGSGCGGLLTPTAIAVDGSGAVWAANYDNAVVSQFSAAGIPQAANGFPGVGLRQSYGLTIDPSGGVWVANQQSVTAAGNSHNGSVSHFSAYGAELSGAGITTGGIYYPGAVAATSTGLIWVANYGNSSATLLAANGSAISPSGYAVSALPFTSAVAVDAAGNGIFGVQQGVARVSVAGTVSSFACCSYPSGVAVDPAGNLWAADYGVSAVEQLSSAGAVRSVTTLGGGNLGPQGLAIDSAGTVWTANYFGNSLSQLASGTGAVLSPTLGFGQDAPLDEPYSIAIDASGDVWLSNSGGSTLTELFGLAAPVRTPALGPPVAP